MKVLIVSSGNNSEGRNFSLKNRSPFIWEQTKDLMALGVEISFFYIRGTGIHGYLKNFPGLLREIKTVKPDLLHAHYGLSGLLANLQRKVPVITTFHGSDLFLFRGNRLLSQLASVLSAYSIVVNERMSRFINISKAITTIPCGVDIELFNQNDPHKDENIRGMYAEKTNILFCSKFDYYEKNYPLASETIKILGHDYNLIELKGYSRKEVAFLLNNCSVALMTSLSEGSPQFIKEAMACNCPIVSTDVGDVKKIFGRTEGCYITTFDPQDVVDKIKLAINFRDTHKYTNGRDRIISLCLDRKSVAERILKVYKKVLSIPS